MEITRDALLRVVKAARVSMKVAETLNQLSLEKKSWTWADEIVGNLADALFMIAGETLTPQQDFFDDSNTVRLLKSDMSDEAVTDWFFMMDRLNKRTAGAEEVEQPKPHIFNAEEVERMSKQTGSYPGGGT